jgi:hypothetical protein
MEKAHGMPYHAGKHSKEKELNSYKSHSAFV